MPVPPNFQYTAPGQDGAVATCRDCVYECAAPAYLDARISCIKHRAFATLMSFCDDFDGIRKKPWPNCHHADLLTEEEKRILAEMKFVNLQLPKR